MKRRGKPPLNLKYAIVDMELPISISLLEVWPNVTVVFCFFHFRQAMMRHFEKFLPANYTLEYVTKYRQEVDMLSYLAAFPAAEIPSLFYKILRGDLTASGSRFIREYFGPNYIYGDGGNCKPR